jgi:hypothetical protein
LLQVDRTDISGEINYRLRIFILNEMCSFGILTDKGLVAGIGHMPNQLDSKIPSASCAKSADSVDSVSRCKPG